MHRTGMCGKLTKGRLVGGALAEVMERTRDIGQKGTSTLFH